MVITKKSDLSDQSSNKEEPKRLHKGSSASGNTSNSPGDVFKESLKPFDYIKIWRKCLQNLDKQVRESNILH